MTRSKRESVSAVEFVKVFAPMAKDGKNAVEIGRALGLEGDADKVAAYVSVKASQLRKRLKESALETAKTKGLDEAATESLVNQLVAKLPRLRGANRPGRTANVVNDILTALDNL